MNKYQAALSSNNFLGEEAIPGKILKRSRNFKAGKLRRHRKHTKRLNTKGFGNRTWSGKQDWYLVELCWENEEGDRENESNHYIACRQFDSVEKKFFKDFLIEGGMSLQPRETVQSQYVLNYVYIYLHHNWKELTLNKAFIYRVVKEGADPAGLPLYMLDLDEKMIETEAKLAYNDRMMATLKKTIYHPKS